MKKETTIIWDEKTGIGRVMLDPPMARAPSLIMEFEDPAIVAETIAPDGYDGKQQVRFKVKGPNGYLLELPPYKLFSLDAEL